MDYRDHDDFIEGVKTGKWSRAQIEAFIKGQDPYNLNSLHDLIIKEFTDVVASKMTGGNPFPLETERLESAMLLVEESLLKLEGKDWKDWRTMMGITDRQWVFIEKARNKGYIEGEGPFTWTRSKADLAYFCEMVFCPLPEDRMPEDLISKVFPSKGARISCTLNKIRNSAQYLDRRKAFEDEFTE